MKHEDMSGEAFGILLNILTCLVRTLAEQGVIDATKIMGLITAAGRRGNR